LRLQPHPHPKSKKEPKSLELAPIRLQSGTLCPI